MQDAKGERYVFHQLAKGQRSKKPLERETTRDHSGLRFPKSMYWTGKGGVRFIRPIRWILALLEDEVFPSKSPAVKSGNTTRGHRILGSKHPFPVTIENYTSRSCAPTSSSCMPKSGSSASKRHLGNDVRKDADLLRTLVYLTEFPTPIRGSFDPAIWNFRKRFSRP